MLPGRLQILHASRKPQEKNLIPLCSAVISSLDSGTAKKKKPILQNKKGRSNRKQDESCHFSVGSKPPELMSELY